MPLAVVAERSSGGNFGHRSTDMEKLPKTKEEIAQLIITELRSFDCMSVLGIVIVPITDHHVGQKIAAPGNNREDHGGTTPGAHALPTLAG